MSKLVYGVSDVHDGSMKEANSGHVLVYENCKRYLGKFNVKPDSATLVYLTYEGDDYCRFRSVDASAGGEGFVYDATVPSDALFTTTKSLALFLPLADCVGTVLYDEVTESLGLAHLGRHNLEQYAGTAAVRYMQQHYGADPKNLHVHLSPAAGKSSYPLFAFDNRGLHEVAVEQLLSAGVKAESITVDHRDTTVDNTLFSHSEFLKGKRKSNGRHAIVAMMR